MPRLAHYKKLPIWDGKKVVTKTLPKWKYEEREDEEGIYNLNSQKNILGWRSFLTFAILTGQVGNDWWWTPILKNFRTTQNKQEQSRPMLKNVFCCKIKSVCWNELIEQWRRTNARQNCTKIEQLSIFLIALSLVHRISGLKRSHLFLQLQLL